MALQCLSPEVQKILFMLHLSWEFSMLHDKASKFPNFELTWPKERCSMEFKYIISMQNKLHQDWENTIKRAISYFKFIIISLIPKGQVVLYRVVFQEYAQKDCVNAFGCLLQRRHGEWEGPALGRVVEAWKTSKKKGKISVWWSVHLRGLMILLPLWSFFFFNGHFCTKPIYRGDFCLYLIILSKSGFWGKVYF